MKYDGITWMGWIINIIFFLVAFGVFMLVFGYSGIWWFLGVLIIGCAIGLHKEVPPYQNDNDSYFTNEDFMHAKIGEWVSRK